MRGNSAIAVFVVALLLHALTAAAVCDTSCSLPQQAKHHANAQVAAGHEHHAAHGLASPGKQIASADANCQPPELDLAQPRVVADATMPQLQVADVAEPPAASAQMLPLTSAAAVRDTGPPAPLSLRI